MRSNIKVRGKPLIKPFQDTCPGSKEKDIYSGIKGKLSKKKVYASNTLEVKASTIDEGSLFFNSRFTSGNLAQATRVSESTYHLDLAKDPNTLQYYAQWYFFSVRNI